MNWLFGFGRSADEGYKVDANRNILWREAISASSWHRPWNQLTKVIADLRYSSVNSQSMQLTSLSHFWHRRDSLSITQILIICKNWITFFDTYLRMFIIQEQTGVPLSKFEWHDLFWIQFFHFIELKSELKVKQMRRHTRSTKSHKHSSFVHYFLVPLVCKFLEFNWFALVSSVFLDAFASGLVTFDALSTFVWSREQKLKNHFN